MNLLISTMNYVKKYDINKNPAFLTCPNGNLMIKEVIQHIDFSLINKIYIIIHKEEFDSYFYLDDFKSMFDLKNIEIIIDIQDMKYKSPAQTIYNCIKKNNIVGSILIKDYKSIFHFSPKIGNYVYYCNSVELSHLDNKSFIQFNNLNQITNISEKEIISNYVNIGAYIFNDVKLFLESYEEICKINNMSEIYISHVIFKCIISNKLFYSIKVNNILDFSREKDWKNYCKEYKTLFVDIDGTLVYNSGEYSKKKWGETDAIQDNVDYLNKLYSTGKVKIILTTARKKIYEQKTIEQLKKNNIPYDDIIFDLYHGKRYLINDYSETNKYPTAISINLCRNQNNLQDFLK